MFYAAYHLFEALKGCLDVSFAKGEASSEPYLVCLPDDVLVLILKKIPFMEFKNLYLTSTRFCRLCYHRNMPHLKNCYRIHQLILNLPSWTSSLHHEVAAVIYVCFKNNQYEFSLNSSENDLFVLYRKCLCLPLLPHNFWRRPLLVGELSTKELKIIAINSAIDKVEQIALEKVVEDFNRFYL